MVLPNTGPSVAPFHRTLTQAERVLVARRAAKTACRNIPDKAAGLGLV